MSALDPHRAKVDRKWIETGLGQSTYVRMFVENVERSLERTRNERIVVFTGADSVQSQVDAIFRN